jgi:hypothetical protein
VNKPRKQVDTLGQSDCGQQASPPLLRATVLVPL